MRGYRRLRRRKSTAVIPDDPHRGPIRNLAATRAGEKRNSGLARLARAPE